MSNVTTFRDLEVWQAGMDLVLSTYRVTESLPSVERYGLSSRMRRAATSIPSNVAEGHARRGDHTYLNHVRIALGSQAELDTQLEISERLGYVDAKTAAQLRKELDRVRQMLQALRRSLEKRFAASVAGAGALLAATGLLLAFTI